MYHDKAEGERQEIATIYGETHRDKIVLIRDLLLYHILALVHLFMGPVRRAWWRWRYEALRQMKRKWLREQGVR